MIPTPPQDRTKKIEKYKKKLQEFLKKTKLKLLGRDEKGRPIRSGKEDQLRGKKLVGMYIVFLLYNLLFITMANESEALAPFQSFGFILTFFNPYVFGNGLTFFFIICGILLSIDKVRQFVYSKWYWQVVFYLAVFLVMYLIAYLIIANGGYMIPFLLILSTFWLVLQSYMYYTSSRGFSTKIETRLVERYSKARTIGAVIIPLIIVGVLLFISWIYRYVWIILALDIAPMFNPVGGVEFYRLLMTQVNPALYFIVIIITLFLTLEFILTMKRAETRSAGVWDNFTFALMSFFLFIWMIFMVTLFLLLYPDSQALWKSLFMGGEEGTGNTGFIVLIAEFVVSMIFLYVIIRDIGKTFGWRVFFLQKDGLVFIFLAIIMGQSVSRFALINEIEPGAYFINSLLSYDRLIIPMLLIVLLGITIIIYYLRPQKMSMFMRREQEAVEQEDRAKDLVLKFLRREFIRKQKKFRVDSIDQRLAELLNIPLSVVHSLIHRITSEYVDIILEEEVTESGKVKYIDFIPITEKYQDSEEADARARQHLTQQFAGSVLAKSGERQKILVKTKRQIEKQKDAAAGDLISTLQSSYTRQAKIKKEKEGKAKSVDFKTDIKEDALEILTQFLRTEYIYRATHPEEYPEPSIKLLDILSKVEEVTRINPAEVYPILEILTLQNRNIVLEENPQEPTNKIISFLPLTDLEISDILEENNPQVLLKLRILIWTELKEAVRFTRNKTLEPIEQLDHEYNPVIKTLLRNLQRMWMDLKHPRFLKPDLTKLNQIITKLTPKSATSWKEYIVTGRARVTPSPIDVQQK